MNTRSTILVAGVVMLASARPPDRPTAALPGCDPTNGGLTLPPGFCALVVADDVGAARHLAVAANGDVYVALLGGGLGGGGVLALRDTTGDGRADVSRQFGQEGGSGLALGRGALFFSSASTVYRYALHAGELTPVGPPDIIVTDLPTRGHSARSLVLTPDGSLFVNIGSRTNSCQVADRQLESRGQDPCEELALRAGVWRFDAARVGQRESDGVRYVTGVRNAVAIALNPANGELYAVQHGRDQLGQNWPKLFTVEQSAETPSEEFIRIGQGDDFGWPYCYHDPALGHLVLAPEYGGDGKRVGRCADKKAPLLGFPGHWAPDGLLFYTGEQFPARYRGGAFIAFHGSWNRAPLPQAGYRVVFVPFANGVPAGAYETFADGFQPGHRPVGLAQGPDGSLYVTDDDGGRIWRVIYKGR